MNLFAKSLSDFHPMQVVFLRALGTFVFIFPWMLFKGISIKGNNPKMLSLRAIAGFFSLALFFYGLQNIPVGSAISIRYVSPIFASLLAIYYLKEKVNVYQWISFVLAMIGAFMLKGFDLRIDFLSFLMILGSAILVGGVFVLVRYLAQREHTLTIINYFMVACLIGSLFSISEWRLPVGEEWWYASFIGVFGLIGQIFMTMAFAREEASTLAPFKYMELVYALIFGYFLLDEKYSALSLLAMFVIIVGMVGNVLVKRLGQKKRESIN